MIKASLALEMATVPAEEAQQIRCAKNEHCERSTMKHKSKFSDDSKENDSHSSFCMIAVLSQPDGLSHYERLLWLQKRRTEGLWVKCDDCGRWRFLSHTIDRYDLPDKWICKMNTDIHFGSCSAPEVPIYLHDEEDLIHSRFTAGSIVWAQLSGWPWWPAMVDDCPDTEQYYWLNGLSEIPTHYNVVFFDRNDATRAWILDGKVECYAGNNNMVERALQNRKYKKRLTAAIKQAEDAFKLPLSLRLTKYSFLTRYKGKILTPSKISKANLEKFQKNLNRQFNKRFSDKKDVSPSTKTEPDTNELCIISTPKRREAIRPKQIFDINRENTKTTNQTNDNYLFYVNGPPDHNEDAETDDKNNSLSMQVSDTKNSAGERLIGKW